MIHVRYKCACMAEEAEVHVDFRGAEQDVVDYVQRNVAGEISADHRRRSPLCIATAMEYAKIEVPPGSDRIGGPTVN